MSAVVLASSARGRVVTWSAGWVPSHGFSVGIVLVVDPVGAGAAVTAGALTTVALVYSWRYMEAEPAHYRPLVVLFLAGMTGFAFTGDLFDMFVFFELMGAAAYALTGMKVEDPSALQGGFNFGLVNSLGAYVSLMGLALLYARTGNLGLAALGRAVAGHRPGALVVAAFVLVLCGFLVKAAVVPFHFWLADAHAVAPAPVCLLFSGIMVPLGVYAVFRVYWQVFSGALPASAVSHAFLALGTLTALLGAVMCLGQRHVKRMLAYSTVAHVGLFMCALALLTQAGTAGALLYVAGHAGAKGALFLLAGVMLARTGSVDEHELYGTGGGGRLVPALWLVGALALAGLPPFGTGLGKSVTESAALAAGDPWLVAVFVAVSAASAGAVLRVTARVYFGLGPRPSEDAGQAETRGQEEQEAVVRRLPPSMAAAVIVLLGGALAEGVIPGAQRAAQRAAALFTSRAGYAEAALHGHAPAVAVAPVPDWSSSGVALGLASAALAVGVAAAGLYAQPLRRRAGAWGRAGTRSLAVLHRAHSGHVGDYVAWMFAGLAVLLVLVGAPVVLAR
jgi:multicomponent Na+:H+ antiporter subunit D